MEINALFDLWDEFAKVEYTSEDEISSQFYIFPAGTSRLTIVGWFMRQSPLFSIQDTLIEGRRTFSPKNNPVT